MAQAGDNAKKALVDELNGVLADHLALYVKTKNFHWHVAGPRFHDLHLLFDEQATAILGVVDLIAERVRKNDADTLTSIGSIASRTAVKDQNKTALPAEKMVEELRDDNAALVARLRAIAPVPQTASAAWSVGGSGNATAASETGGGPSCSML